MRTLRYIVLALLFLLVVVVIVGFFLPAKVRLERSIEINRKAPVVFSVINSLNNFNKWSPWYNLDLNANYVVTGPKSGVGSKIVWQGNAKVGKGSNEIIASQQNAFIKTKFFFGKNDQPAYSTLSLAEKDQKTTVTWAFENDFGYNVFYRYFGLVLEDMIAPDYEKGLSNLKTYVESLPLYDYSNISVVNTQAENIYTLVGHVDMSQQNISEEIAKSYQKIISFLTTNKISMNGSPKIITLNYNGGIFDFLAAIPVLYTSIEDPSGLIKSAQMYAGKALKLVYKGPLKNIKKQYTVLNSYLAQNQIKKNGNSWEDYVTDPATVDKDEIITHIYQPIK